MIKVSFSLPFTCEPRMRPHLEKVFSGEYDVPVSIQAPVILDLGANAGAFSIWATHRWPDSTVFAYEPHPKSFEFFRGNTLGYVNIKGYNWGVGTPGMRILREGRWNSGEASFHLGDEGTTGHTCEVREPASLPTADILKLDVEGCEMEILKPLIEGGRKFYLILLEYHKEELRREIDALLRDYTLIGAEVTDVRGRGLLKYVRTDLDSVN